MIKFFIVGPEIKSVWIAPHHVMLVEPVDSVSCRIMLRYGVAVHVKTDAFDAIRAMGLYDAREGSDRNVQTSTT